MKRIFKQAIAITTTFAAAAEETPWPLPIQNDSYQAEPDETNASRRVGTCLAT